MCKKREGVGFVVTSNKISGKGAYTQMRIQINTQRFETFVRDLQDSFWGDFQGRTRETLQKLLEADSEQQMADYLGLKWYERPAGEAGRIDYRNGFYEREYVVPLGVLRLRVSRTRLRSFLPRGMRALERRSPEVSEMIRQAFLRGISTRGVGRVVSLLTGESVSAQTVSRLTRVLDKEVEKFHHAPLGDDWCYLILDGVWLKVRRAFGPQKVRRRTRPMVVFTNVESVDRIIYAIFSRFNEDWKNHTLKLFTQAA